MTCLEDGPVFWERASGSNVEDVDGNRFVDLLAGFGVSILGYANAELAEVASRQLHELPHAMGDVYPARVKVEFLEALARVMPGDLESTILSSSGSDAVESSLKTAMRVTGRADVIAFEGAYHGLGLGALDVTHRSHFRDPFRARLPERTRFLPFGDAQAVRESARREPVAAILFEPIQGRGGLSVAPRGFLQELREIADATGALLIADEVYTGVGRTGRWLACEDEPVTPDLVALGKGLGAGFPLSACVGRREIMERWGPSTGEAIHTSTHLGNPVGCAIALRVLDILERDDLLAATRRKGERLRARLERDIRPLNGVVDVRGQGLMQGVELEDADHAWRVVGAALRAGWILLGEGEDGRVLALTPALTIADELLDTAVDVLAELIPETLR